MMKLRHSIYILLAVCVSLTAVSCIDEVFVDDGYGTIGNTIRFNVTSGFGGTDAVTRSGDNCGNDSDDLDPVVLSAGCDTLYLHRDVVSESGRATGRELEAVTRAVPVNTVDDFISVNGESGFRVMATFTDDNNKYFQFSTAVPCTSGEYGDVWHVTDPKRYWPDGRELRFDAFAPASAETLLENLDFGGTVTFGYIVPTYTDGEGKRRDAEHQPDVMLATTSCTHNTDPDVHTDLAPLNFRHALSAIKFAVRDVTTGEIVDISIKGVAGSGKCTFNPEAESAPAFTWTDLGDAVDYMQTFNYVTKEEYPNLPALADATVINNEMPEKTFMLIPQEIPEDAVLELTFKNAKGELKTLKGKLKTADIPLWEAGKEYIYTISTSSENWTYVFEVTGSVQTENDEEPNKGSFMDDPDNIIVNHTVTEGAYYKVKSYRYRTNNPDIKQAVEWTATVLDKKGEIQAYGENGSDDSIIQGYINEYKDRIKMTYTPEEWFPETEFTDDINGDGVKDTFTGNGSTDFSEYSVVFKPQYVATSWSGDWQMRANTTVGTKDAPIDLSKRNGGLNERNTANCYIVNRGGWYAIPLVYGNAITNGSTNLKSYVNERKNADAILGYTAHDFVKHDDTEINSPYISDADNATLLWEDAYNIINPKTVELRTIDGEQFVVFQVLQEDLQQSNSIVAVRDQENTILWSWHLWVSEYWFDESDDLVINSGLVECETYIDDTVPTTAGVTSFTASPCNLGWCDAKNVELLKRTGKITFTQTGNPKKPAHNLDVLQREHLIEYWIGNNTYYQWGRKDPMVGFINSDNKTKNCYGPITYSFRNSLNPPATIGRGIKEPQNLLIQYNIEDKNVEGLSAPTTNDWITTNSQTYYNLWNNYAGQGVITVEGKLENNCKIYTPEYAYSAVKTVYDPSPAGFVVPPSTFFNVFVKGRVNNSYSDKTVTTEEGFNGTYTEIKRETGRYPNRYYIWIANATANGDGGKVVFYPTGQRWDKAFHAGLQVSPGDNMNPHIVYHWTNNANINNQPITILGNSAYCFCLGPEGDPKQTAGFLASVTHFNGRKSMARSVRCVKEYQH